MGVQNQGLELVKLSNSLMHVQGGAIPLGSNDLMTVPLPDSFRILFVGVLDSEEVCDTPLD